MTKRHLTRWQTVLAGVIGLVLTYILGSRALDTGSWWQYGGTLVLLGLSIRLFLQSFRTQK